jgi:hypothetical protein
VSEESQATVSADDLRGDIPPSLASFAQRPSEETDRRSSTWLPLSLLVTAAAVTTVGGILLLRSHVASWLAPAAFVAGPFFLISAAALSVGISREKHLEKAEDEACKNDSWDLYWALNDIEDRTLKGLAWVNYKKLASFTKIAQRQARMSFYTSLVAAAAALLVLTSIAAVAIGLPTTAAKVTAGLLATAGSALSGLLAKTFLRSYQMASRQMSYYYGQPLVHCYLLLAGWLAAEGREEFGKDDGRLLLKRVIDASIKAGADAQDHLLSMQEHGLDGRSTRSVRRRPRVPRQEKASPVPHPFGPLPGAN